MALKNAVGECNRLNLRIKEVDEIEELLKLPHTSLLKLQLARSVDLGDVDRVVMYTLDIKDMHFKHFMKPGQFDLSMFPKLKTPGEFAQRFKDRRSRPKSWNEARAQINRRKKGMLDWTNEPLHASLSHLPEGVPPATATAFFALLQAHMGELEVCFVCTLVEVCVCAYRSL